MVTIGDKFGKLLVVSFAFKKDSRNFWNCICDCGQTKIVIDYNLVKNKGTKSCGCLLKEKCGKQLEDITGKKFGKLTVISKLEEKRNNRVVWKTICECGKEKLHLTTTLKRGLTVSCGCHKAAKARENCKERHYNWRGGVTSQNTKDRNSNQYAIWRTQVFIKDNFTCKVCLKPKAKLNAHHLECFHANKELRFEVDNGITLCKHCHDSFHREFGKINNNRQQFVKFIEAYNEK